MSHVVAPAFSCSPIHQAVLTSFLHADAITLEVTVRRSP